MVFLVSRTSSLRPEHSAEKHAILSTLYRSLGDQESRKHPVCTISHDTGDESVEVIRNELGKLGLSLT
jgi:hypothetical protein